MVEPEAERERGVVGGAGPETEVGVEAPAWLLTSVDFTGSAFAGEGHRKPTQVRLRRTSGRRLLIFTILFWVRRGL